MKSKITSLWAVVLLMVACGGNDQPMATDAWSIWQADSASLKVAVMPTLDCLPLYVAEECGLFDREGLSVTLYPYEAQMDCDTALQNGWVDGMMTDLVRAERLQEQGLPLHYATATALSWQLITSRHARINTLPQLDDKMLAMTRYSGTSLLADLLVDSAGLQPERVFRIQVNDVCVRLDMLRTGVMDALLLPEPQASVALKSDGKRLYDSRQSDLWLGVMVFSQQSMSDSVRHQQVEALLRAYAAACDTLTVTGLAPYKSLIANRCQLNVADLDSLSLDVTFPAVGEPRQTDIDKAKAWLEKVTHQKTQD